MPKHVHPSAQLWLLAQGLHYAAHSTLLLSSDICTRCAPGLRVSAVLRHMHSAAHKHRAPVLIGISRAARGGGCSPPWAGFSQHHPVKNPGRLSALQVLPCYALAAMP